MHEFLHRITFIAEIVCVKLELIKTLIPICGQ